MHFVFNRWVRQILNLQPPVLFHKNLHTVAGKLAHSVVCGNPYLPQIFASFIGKDLCWSLTPFNQACNFMKERLQHRCFPVKFCKSLKNTFLTEHLRWLLLNFINVFYGTGGFFVCSREFRKVPVT